MKTSLEKIFQSEIFDDRQKYPYAGEEIFTDVDIMELPEPVRRYFHYSGYIGKKKAIRAWIKWKNMFIKMAPEKPWMKLNCSQYNCVSEPTRIVYMRSHIFGVVPFEGRDKFQNGHGNMLIKVMKAFTVLDAKGIEMDKSELVTVLAEALMVPMYALQNYITWTPIDFNSAKATLTFGGTTVSGVFNFNFDDGVVRFDTKDRYYEGLDGKTRNIPWSVISENFVEKNGIKFPSQVRAVWHDTNGDFEYIKGTIDEIDFNVAHFN